MKTYEALKLNTNEKEIISFVGGGGKTTTIFKLAKELKSIGKKVLVTTTTAMYDPKEERGYFFIGDFEEDFSPRESSITILGKEVRKGKLLGLSQSHVDRIAIKGLFDFILIEADGAKRKPIKAMASHEPLVSKSSTKTIGIIGMDCLKEPIEHIVHRPEIFADIVEKEIQQEVDERDVVRIILHPDGLFKAAKGSRILILNKIDNKDRLIKGYSIRDKLLREGFKGNILLADIMKGYFY